MLTVLLLAAVTSNPISQLRVVELPHSLSQLRGTISGCDGSLLPDVQVELRNNADPDKAGLAAHEAQQKVVAKTNTDERGRFTLPTPNPGKYDLRLRKPGWDSLAIIVRITEPRIAQFTGQLHLNMPISGAGSCDLVEPIDLRFISPGPGSSISSYTDLETLRRRFGAANVTEGDVWIGEGDTTSGTILFAKDDRQRLELAWNQFRIPKFVQIYGERSKWRTIHGITLGTTLKQLEELNGRPFTLSGFETDYSGTVRSWEGGNLERVLAGVFLRLEPARNARNEDVMQAVGDDDFSSQHPMMQKLNPRVRILIIGFE